MRDNYEISVLRGKIRVYEEKIQYLIKFLNEMCEYEGEYSQTIPKIEILEEIIDGFFGKGVADEDASFGTLRNEYENRARKKKSDKLSINGLMNQSYKELQKKYTDAQVLIVNFRVEIKKLEEQIAFIESMGG